MGEYHTHNFGCRGNRTILLWTAKTVPALFLSGTDLFFHTGRLLYHRFYIHAAGACRCTDHHLHREEKDYARLDAKNPQPHFWRLRVHYSQINLVSPINAQCLSVSRHILPAAHLRWPWIYGCSFCLLNRTECPVSQVSIPLSADILQNFLRQTRPVL